MTQMAGRALFSLLGLTLGLHAFAQPDLTKSISAGPLTVIHDDSRAGLYYYLPGDLRIDTDPDGQPGLRLLQLRYIGTRAMGDQGSTVFRSLLSVQIIMDGPDPGEIEEARQALSTTSSIGRIELRPLPVGRLEATLVYAPIGETESLLPQGYFEAGSEAGATNRGAYWRERIYTVPLDPHDAQLVWATLIEQQVVLSLGYAFFATGLQPETPLAVLEGSPTLVGEIEKSLRHDSDENVPSASGIKPILVKAGATSITADVGRWPTLLRRIDVNEQLPPGYPLLEVYCYDFRDNLRPELELKIVDVEAVGVAGKPVSGQVLFERNQPDLYAQGLSLPFAVRMDEPYRYRISEIDSGGDEERGVWQEATSWGRILDVTTRAGELEDDAQDFAEEKE